MDYIIITLWGIIAGGILWGGSSHSGASQPQLVEQEPIVVQAPRPQVSHQTQAAEPLQVIEQPLISTAPKKRSGSTKPIAFTRSNVESTGRKPSDSSASEPKNKAISFTNQKPGVVVENVPIVDVPLADAAVEVHDTVAVFPVVTDGVPDSLSMAIVDPLFDAEPVSAPVYKQSNLSLPGQLTVDQLLCDDDGMPLIHTLLRGETLTQISQRYYSDSRFWPYVYEVNRYQLSSPDKIQADMKLYLPDPTFFDINSNDPAAVDKAKTLINKYSK